MIILVAQTSCTKESSSSTNLPTILGKWTLISDSTLIKYSNGTSIRDTIIYPLYDVTTEFKTDSTVVIKEKVTGMPTRINTGRIRMDKDILVWSYDYLPPRTDIFTIQTLSETNLNLYIKRLGVNSVIEEWNNWKRY